MLVDPVVNAAENDATADCAGLLDRPCFNPHDEDVPSLLDLLEWAQRTGVIDRADAALLIELMLAADWVNESDRHAARARALSALRDAGGQYLAAVA